MEAAACPTAIFLDAICAAIKCGDCASAKFMIAQIMELHGNTTVDVLLKGIITKPLSLTPIIKAVKGLLGVVDTPATAATAPVATAPVATPEQQNAPEVPVATATTTVAEQQSTPKVPVAPIATAPATTAATTVAGGGASACAWPPVKAEEAPSRPETAAEKAARRSENQRKKTEEKRQAAVAAEEAAKAAKAARPAVVVPPKNWAMIVGCNALARPQLFKVIVKSGTTSGECCVKYDNRFFTVSSNSSGDTLTMHERGQFEHDELPDTDAPGMTFLSLDGDWKGKVHPFIARILENRRVNSVPTSTAEFDMDELRLSFGQDDVHYQPALVVANVRAVRGDNVQHYRQYYIQGSDVLARRGGVFEFCDPRDVEMDAGLKEYVDAPFNEESWAPNPDFINCVRIGHTDRKFCGTMCKGYATMVLNLTTEKKKFVASQFDVDEGNYVAYIGGEEISYVENVRSETRAQEKANNQMIDAVLAKMEKALRRK